MRGDKWLSRTLAQLDSLLSDDNNLAAPCFDVPFAKVDVVGIERTLQTVGTITVSTFHQYRAPDQWGGSKLSHSCSECVGIEVLPTSR